MKSVSWASAFSKLNEWAKCGCPVTFGEVREVEIHEETINIFSGESGTRVLSADEQTGEIVLFAVGSMSLTGVSFKFSDFEDSPFVGGEGLGSMDDAMEQLEAKFPDGKTLVFARMYDF